MLILGIVILAAAIALTTFGVVAHNAVAVVGILLFPAADACFHGPTPAVPGEARVLQLFGAYRGTVREPGLRWVNPFTRRRKVSVRVRNHQSPIARVNDAEGNPIEIDRPGEAAPAAGERGRRRPAADCRRRCRHGRLALERLEEEGVIELDEERKAAMVSDLLVVLCSEQAAQQVVNTGSLHQ